MTAVTIVIAVTGCVVACNVAVVMLGYTYKTAKLRGARNGEASAYSPLSSKTLAGWPSGI